MEYCHKCDRMIDTDYDSEHVCFNKIERRLKDDKN